MYSILFFCLKIQMACWSGRPGPAALTQEAEERMFCFKSAESSLLSAFCLFFLPLTPLWLPLQAQWMLGGDPRLRRALRNYNRTDGY